MLCLGSVNNLNPCFCPSLPQDWRERPCRHLRSLGVWLEDPSEGEDMPCLGEEAALGQRGELSRAEACVTSWGWGGGE